jgi:P4 family phage/plasmid primase-like protien
MFALTISSNNSSDIKEFDSIESVFDHIKSLPAEESPEIYIFGKSTPKTEMLESSQFIVLCLTKPIEPAIEKLAEYHYLSWENNEARLIIVPVESPFDGSIQPDITLQLAAFLRCENLLHHQIQVQSIPVKTLKSATIHQRKKLFSVTELPVIPTLQKVNITIPDSYISDARGVIDYYEGHFIYTENKAFYYVKNEGIWKGKSKDNFLKYLATEFYKDSRSPKEINQIFNALKMITYKDQFPRCIGEHNVIAFENCSLIPAENKRIDHSETHYSRHKVEYDYDPNAPQPIQWLTFLSQLFDTENKCHFEDSEQHQAAIEALHNYDEVKLLQEYMGLSLTNITKFQKMLMLIGVGSNGKSVILKIVAALLGEGNVSKVSLKDLNNKFNLVALNGKLVNMDCDLDVNALSSDAKFKAIVAGEEMVLENKFEKTFKTPIEVKLWAAGNAFPNVKNDSHGYYRRVMPLMFTRVFSEDKQNRELEHELEAELSGILNWALAGLKRLLKEKNFTVPESSKNALLEYQNANNSVARFFNEYLQPLVDAKPSEGILCSKVFNAYRIFALKNNLPMMSDSMFGKKLKALSMTVGEGDDKVTLPVMVAVGKSNSNRYYLVTVREDVITEKAGAGDDAMKEFGHD